MRASRGFIAVNLGAAHDTSAQMFTGLVQGVGELTERTEVGSGIVAWVKHAFGPLTLGESIAVSGVCLTVTGERMGPSGREFSVDISAETLACTKLGEGRPKTAWNLERALAVGDRLGGHWVTGHVDGLGEIVEIVPHGEMRLMRIALPRELGRYAARKGSLTMDGVSLTINSVTDADGRTIVDLFLIPHTLAVTTLGALSVGSQVNVEVDLMARYVERLRQGDS